VQAHRSPRPVARRRDARSVIVGTTSSQRRVAWRPQSGTEWLILYAGARLAATVVALALLLWGEVGGLDLILVLYGPLSTALLVSSGRLRTWPVAWAVDSALTLALVLHSDDWRSPYYLMWLTSLALPAIHLTLRRAVLLAIGSSLRRVDEALRTRARELTPGDRPSITVEGAAPELPPLVAACRSTSDLVRPDCARWRTAPPASAPS
jgi:hypothetical protein